MWMIYCAQNSDIKQHNERVTNMNDLQVTSSVRSGLVGTAVQDAEADRNKAKGV